MMTLHIFLNDLMHLGILLKEKVREDLFHLI